tara:strand:- start:1169 stop:1411 length:243 start_codon:yes stop_codon:yes gene_type:complete
MVDVDVQMELTQVNTQLEQLVVEYNKKDAEMKQLMQQIQNLNGIAMYLRGKIEGTPQAEISPNNTSHDEIPDIATIVNDA